MVSATQLFDVPFGTESKKEISKLLGDIFQKCGAKEAKVRGFLTIIIILKIILMCLEVYTMRSNTLSIGNTGRIMVLGLKNLCLIFHSSLKKKNVNLEILLCLILGFLTYK